MHNQALYLALRVAVRLLPYLPLAAVYWVARLVALVYFHTVSSASAGIASNLAVAFPEMSAAERTVIARAAFINNALNWVDTLRIPTVGTNDVVRMVDLHGREHLDEALGSNGMLLVSMHLGNFDLVGQLLAADGHSVTVPVERIRPPELFRFLTAQRESQGIHTVPIDRAPRRMLAALRRGEVVALTADRLLGGKALTVSLCGRPTDLPRGPASLARHTGVPVVFGVGVRVGLDSYRGFVAAPLRCPRTADAVEDERILTQQLAGFMEGFIRRYPDQWIAFQPLWPDGGDAETTATMKRQSGAAV